MSRIANDIHWDTDGEYFEELPLEVEIPEGVEDDEVADFLSDEYGFCVESFVIEEM